MNYFNIGIVLALCFFGSAFSQCANSKYETIGTGCYYFSSDIVNWYQAKLNCQLQYGGRLVIPSTSTLDLDLSNYLKANDNGNNYWIDATSVGLTFYIWDAIGETVQYDNWYGTPLTNGCGYYDGGEAYTWGTSNTCDTDAALYICELYDPCAEQER